MSPQSVVDLLVEPDAEVTRAIRVLMDAAFGERFDDHDFDHSLGGTHLAIRRDGTIVSHAAVVERRLYVGDEVLRCGYVEAVATLPAFQRQGLGTAVMDAAGRLIGAQFDVGALSTGSPAFYERLGWRCWTGPTHVVSAGEWRRTPDEDGGVLVLAGTCPLDLARRIGVDERAGDDW